MYSKLPQKFSVSREADNWNKYVYSIRSITYFLKSSSFFFCHSPAGFPQSACTQCCQMASLKWQRTCQEKKSTAKRANLRPYSPPKKLRSYGMFLRQIKLYLWQKPKKNPPNIYKEWNSWISMLTSGRWKKEVEEKSQEFCKYFVSFFGHINF